MNGIFAVDKPAGASSSHVVLQIKKIFSESSIFASDLALVRQKVRDDLIRSTKFSASKIENKAKKACFKIGHGGTLDPLASGILIIGVGTGTKQLAYYLGQCTKTYETRAVLGQATTTGDSEGELIKQTLSDNISLQDLRMAARKFVGKLKQTPPIFSALKVNGKPLYEYAREGIPVPKDSIKSREILVSLVEVHDDFGIHDTYKALRPSGAGDSLEKLVFENPTLDDHALSYSEEFMNDETVSAEAKNTTVPFVLKDPSAAYVADLPVFHATATVGSGTYIRSLVSDIGRACGSSAFMCELKRTKQGEWELGKNVFSMSDFTDRDEKQWGPVLQEVLEKGPSVDVAEAFRSLEGNRTLREGSEPDAAVESGKCESERGEVSKSAESERVEVSENAESERAEELEAAKRTECLRSDETTKRRKLDEA